MPQRASYLNSLTSSTATTRSLVCDNRHTIHSREQRLSTSIAILISLLIHAIILATSPGLINANNTKSRLIQVTLQPEVAQAVNVHTDNLLDKNKHPATEIKKPTDLNLTRQIVSSSTPIEKSPDKPTRFLSDKDSSTEKDQIKRGDSQIENTPPASPITIAPEQGQAFELKAQEKGQEKGQEKVAQKKRLSPSSENTLDTNKLLAKKDTSRREPPPQKRNPPPAVKDTPLSATGMFLSNRDMASLLSNSKQVKDDDRSPGTNATVNSSIGQSDTRSSESSRSAAQTSSDSRLSAFALSRGSSDYLPDIPDGEVTLLNAKANRYALFVRRVAEKVFGELRSSHWRNLGRGDAKRASGTTIVFATLSPAGKLLNLKIEDSSGSTQFDQTVYQSIQNGAWDQNPPSGATASDGNIHFVFESQLRTQPSPNPSGEARWLMLGTGLL